MNNRYILDYLDEDTFKKLERSLKKYNMVAYKKLMFDFYPRLRSGEFVGELVSINNTEQTETYDLVLPTDSLFVKVYGVVKLNYTVHKKNNTIILNKLEPKDILLSGSGNELTAYKGIMISKANAQKEMFKIDLLCRLEGRDGSLINTSNDVNYELEKYIEENNNESKDNDDLIEENSTIFINYITYGINVKSIAQFNYNKLSPNDSIKYYNVLEEIKKVIKEEVEKNYIFNISNYYKDFQYKNCFSLENLMYEALYTLKFKMLKIFDKYYIYKRISRNINQYIDNILAEYEKNIKNDFEKKLKENYALNYYSAKKFLKEICKKYNIENYINYDKFLNDCIINSNIKLVSLDIENKKEYSSEEQEILKSTSKYGKTLYYVLSDIKLDDYFNKIDKEKLELEEQNNNEKLESEEQNNNDSLVGWKSVFKFILIVTIIVLILYLFALMAG